MADNKSARIISGIPETQSLDFSRPIHLKNDKTIVKTISFTAAQLKGIDRISVTCCNMAYSRASFVHDIDLEYVTAAGINFVNDAPNDQASLAQVHESVLTAVRDASGNVTLTWARSAYLNTATGAYTVTTTSTGYGIVNVVGWQSFSLVDTYLRSEIDAMWPKMGIVRTNGASLLLKADSRAFPAGTTVYFNHYYVGSGTDAEAMVTFSRDTSTTSSGTANGGQSALRWLVNISGYVALTNILAKGAEITIGTLSVGASTGYPSVRSLAYGGA
jgi:hypothetical protein